MMSNEKMITSWLPSSGATVSPCLESAVHQAKEEEGWMG